MILNTLATIYTLTLMMVMFYGFKYVFCLTTRLIAILLNGSQGVFLFLSYTCNQRVVRLYRRALGADEDYTSTTTSQSTLGKLGSFVFRRHHNVNVEGMDKSGTHG